MASILNATVPAPETAASRHNRDLVQRRGDWQVTSGTLANNLTTAGKTTYDADGRLDREYLQRRGDWETVATENSLDHDANSQYVAGNRNAREYVNRTNGVSAINGQVSFEFTHKDDLTD